MRGKQHSAVVVLAAVLSAALTVCPPLWANPPEYVIVDLGRLPGGNASVARAVNNAGQVVGYASTADRRVHAFLWEDGEGMRDLGTLGGPDSKAFDINDAGRIVGWSHDAASSQRACVWDPERMINVGEKLGGVESWASGVNASGRVCGNVRRSSNQHPHGFVWDGLAELIDLGPNTDARDINDRGDVAGFVYNGPTGLGAMFNHAALWTFNAGTYRATIMGTLGGPHPNLISRAYGLNESAHLVGESHNASLVLVPFLWDSPSSRIYALGGLGGPYAAANAINEAGQAVGYAAVRYARGNQVITEIRAALWQAGAVWNLNDLVRGGCDWVLRVAYDINDAGWIVGYGDTAGEYRAFLLLPVSACPGDADGDNAVDLTDVGMVMRAYGTFPQDPGYDPRADVAGDCRINIADLSMVLANFGTTCE